jgi:hypothetical protein
MDLRIEIGYDEDADSPRLDREGTLFLGWHKRYSIGDPKPSHRFERPTEYYPEREDLLAALREELTPVAELPVFMVDHSGTHYSTGDFGDKWDSGQVGWIFALPSDRWDGLTPEQIADVLRSEIAEYGTWANGGMREFRIYNESGELLASSCGYYSEEDAQREADEERSAILTREARDEVACQRAMAL